MQKNGKKIGKLFFFLDTILLHQEQTMSRNILVNIHRHLAELKSSKNEPSGRDFYSSLTARSENFREFEIAAQRKSFEFADKNKSE
jgi:hypothetical protein